MKKYACLILFALLLNGCDDGDLTVDTINFEDITTQTCDPLINTLLYKLKEQESLLLQLPANTLKNDATKPGEPLILNIDNNGNGIYRVVYRAYDGTVATANICGQIPPKTPNVTEEWLGISGRIVIVSTQEIKTDPTTLATSITGYNHTINFENITFDKPSGIAQVEELFPFGTFKTTITSPIVVQFTDQNAGYCPSSNKIYNDNGSAALIIKNFDSKLLLNEETPTGKPRTAIINTTATSNNVSYETYRDGVLPENTDSYFCASVTPAVPAVAETWTGQTGDTTKQTGIIEVTTREEANAFRHTITLKAATLQKGNSSFYLGTSLVIGSVTTAK